MNWFHKTIAILTLVATGSALFLTASRMNSHLAAYFTKSQNQHPAAVAESTQMPPQHSSPQNTTDTHKPEESSEKIVTIPDAALTGSNPEANTVSHLSTSYEYQVSTVGDELYTRTNIIRSQNHLPSFLKDVRLATLAKERSEDMLTRGYFSHTTPEGCDLSCRFKASNYPSLVWGENLATFTNYTTLSEAAVAEQFIDDWLASSAHRQNMLSTSFTHQGIGVAIQGDTMVVTVLFARP